MNNLQILKITIIFVKILKLASPAPHPDVKHSEFCYDNPNCGPSHWGGLCSTGKQQSPIDISLGVGQKFIPSKFWMNDHYLLESVHRFYAQNNGHTAQFELNPNTSALYSNLEIYGGELTANYKFAQLHFHWGKVDSDGSEHTLNGTRYPMEVHLVHYKSIYSSLTDAVRSTDDNQALAVMAVFFKIGGHNKNLDPIINALTKLNKPGEVKEFDFTLKILNLYPDNQEYARYLGSLTTPTCDEKVVWTVFLKPLEISEGQITQFRIVSNAEGNADANYRPTQATNGRQVKFYAAEG